MDVKLKLIKLSFENFVLPKPSGETEKEFISRCMEDSTMIKEFPREDQRAAVCYKQYRGK